MSGAEHEKPDADGKNEPSRGGSSLTDAVVAALAKVDDEGEKKAGEPPAAEAGCAATQEGTQSAPPPVVQGGAPAPAAGANGFRSGPGSFADLMRRWSGAPAAPTGARGAPAGEPAPAPASEQPARADTPAPASEPAAAEEPAPASEPAAVEEPAPASEEPAKADAPAPPSDEPTEPEARAEDETIRHSTEGVAGASGPIEVRYFGRTDVGLVREHNEDNFLVADLEADVRDSSEPREVTVGAGGCIFAVCDGMGGAAAGEVASQMAVDTIYEVLDGTGPPEDRDEFARRLVRSIEEAGHRIFSAAKMDRTRRGMGTTATLAGLVDDVLFVGQVGDSRAYVLRGDQLEMITKDQSLVNQLIEAGQLTEEEAEAFEHSNIILQALGTTEEVTVDLTFLEMRKGDRLMMCSDGLSGLVHAEMIKEVMQETSDLTECADKLIQMANAGGGHDNITVILADFDGAGLKEAEGAKVVYQQYPLPLDERGRGDSVPPRETSIKTGGPKPGADVKRDDHGAAATDAAVPSEGGGSKMWLVLLLLVGLVALLAGGYLVMNGALGAGDADVESADPPPPPPPVDEPETLPVEPTEPEGDPAGAAGEGEAAAAEEVATITIQTDVEGGTLHVNGQPHGPLTDGMTLDLAPGAYTFEAHLGDSTSAEAEPVSVNAGDAITVQLTMPTGESDAPEPEEEPAPAGAEPASTGRGGARGGGRGRRGGQRGGGTRPDGLPSNPF